MQTHRAGDSRSFQSRIVFACLLLFVGGVFAAWSVAAPSPRASLNKISPWLRAHVLPNESTEFLVVLADQADLSGARAFATKEDKGRFVRDELWTKAQTTQAPLRRWLQDRHVEHRAFYIVNMLWVKAPLALAQQIAARPDVLRIEANPQIHNALPQPVAISSTNATTAVEPGINYTHAPDVWSLGYTGQGIVVGGQDTGYRWTHAALKNHYRGWNGTTADHNYNWHDSIHSAGAGNPCGSNATAPCDDNGHGTHTIGTAVGDDGSGNQIGMAPNAKWIGCRDMDQGNGSPATYLECFEFFLAPYPVGGTSSQGDPTKAPDVTTNSWGCPASEGCSVTDLQAAAEAQRAAGIMTVVAAENSGPGCSTVNDQPAIFDAAYSIGALTTGSDTIASFSSRGPVALDGSNRIKPDLCAPGTNTRSAYRTSDSAYANLSGTSMATPHVAGAVALLWSAQPWLRHDVDRTEAILNNTAVPVAVTNVCSSSGVPNNVYGHGRLNVKGAVDAALMRILGLTNDGTSVTVYFYAVQNRTYRLERKINMVADTWQSIPGVADFTANTTGVLPIVDPTGGGQPQAFYHVRILP